MRRKTNQLLKRLYLFGNFDRRVKAPETLDIFENAFI